MRPHPAQRGISWREPGSGAFEAAATSSPNLAFGKNGSGGLEAACSHIQPDRAFHGNNGGLADLRLHAATSSPDLAFHGRNGDLEELRIYAATLSTSLVARLGVTSGSQNAHQIQLVCGHHLRIALVSSLVLLLHSVEISSVQVFDKDAYTSTAVDVRSRT